MYTIVAVFTSIFLRRDFKRQESCILSSVLSLAGCAVPVTFFTLGSLVMFCNCVIIIRSLAKSKKNIRELEDSAMFNTASANEKLSRAIILTVIAYISFYFPVVVVICINLLSSIPKFIGNILEDISLLFYYCNNLINPFIYCLTLKNFRKGYAAVLLMRKESSMKKKTSSEVKAAVCIKSVTIGKHI